MDKTWWEKNPDWQNQSIPSTQGKSAKSAWILVLMVSAFVGFVLFDIREDLLAAYHSADYINMKEALLVLLPLFFFVKAIRDTLKRNRYGEARLTLNPFPAFIGERLAGSVDLTETIDSNTVFGELLLVQRIKRQHKDNHQYRQSMQWKMPVEVTVEPGLLGSTLLVDTRLPDDKPPSGEPWGEYYSWRLTLYNKNKSMKLSWNIPILSREDYLAP